jgi:hypothetical protein
MSRKQLNIDENAVVYISGANFYKIIPEVEATWVQIITQVPNSILLLYPFNPNWAPSYPIEAFKERFSATLSQHGVSEERLVLLNALPNRADIKEYLKLANIYLDAYPFSGMTSLIDPLQVGLPTIVMQGESARSRRGASLLRCLEIPELIADSEEAYIQLAVDLGNNSNLRVAYGDRIETKMQANPQFLDSRYYSTQMGALFQKVFQEYLTENSSENLNLREINSIVFPDWNQSEESLYKDFASLLKQIISHRDKSKMTLLIYTAGISDEDANMALSSMIMNLMMAEELDVEEGPEISLVGEMAKAEWEALLSCIKGRIVLECEDRNTIAQLPVQDIPIFSLDSIN